MPTQQGMILTQARVRVPSPTGLFVMHTLAGIAGVAVAVGVAEVLRRSTRLSPGVRAGLTAGTGLIGGALVGRTSPRAGTGLTLGGIAAAAPAAIEAIETMAAVREAAPTLPARSEPVTTPAPAPAIAPTVVPPSSSVPEAYVMRASPLAVRQR